MVKKIILKNFNKIMNISKIKKNLSTIILCGGKGKRLYPLTKNIPKPLIKIKNKEILCYILDHLSNFKINDIILATGYKHKIFLNFHSKIKNKSNIKILNTGEDEDIIKRILKCEKICKDYILICYGDTLVDLDIDKLISFFLKNQNKITLSSYNFKSQFGLMKVAKNGDVKSFIEKPDLGLYFNIGFFIMKKEKLKTLKSFKSFKSFLENKTSKPIFRSFIHKGSHITVNTISELSIAKEKLNEMKYA